MTVPASSLPFVLPGAAIPTRGSGGTASTGGAPGFEALLAGQAQGGVQAGPTRGAFAPEADAERPADDDAAAQDAVVALLSGTPAQAPIVAIPTGPGTGTEGADDVTFAARQIRVPGFAAWRPTRADVALPNSPPSEPVTPATSQVLQSDLSAPPVAPTPTMPSLDTLVADARATRTFVATPAADPTAGAPSTLPHPSPDAVKAAPAVPAPPVAQVQPTPAAPPPPPTATLAQAQTLVPPVVDKTAAATASAVATVRATVAPASAAAVEGEPRRTTSAARNERRTDTAGPATFAPSDAASDASPVKLAALAAAETMTGGVDADVAGDPAFVEAPEVAEARQPAQIADARVPAAQAAAVTADTTAARATPETVARFTADVVRKLNGQSTRFDIQLDPYGLGKVDVAIEIDRNGKLTAAMSFDSPQSAADLGNRAADLRLALEQAGFEVAEDGLTFDLAGQGGGFGGREAGQQQDRAWTGRAFQRAQSGADETDLSRAIAPSPTDRRTRSGVDIRI